MILLQELLNLKSHFFVHNYGTVSFFGPITPPWQNPLPILGPPVHLFEFFFLNTGTSPLVVPVRTSPLPDLLVIPVFLVADSVREEADLLLVKAEVSSQVEQVHSQAHSATHKTPFHLPVSGGQSVDNVSSPEYNTRM